VSEPFAVIVHHGDVYRRREPRERLDVYGPFDEDEADALAARLRNAYELDADVVLLRAWTERDAER
jgi:hypothetical protein